MQTVLKVEGMSCSHCEGVVKNAVAAISGVAEVTVDLSAKTVSVVHDENVAVACIQETIEDQGFDVVGQD